MLSRNMFWKNNTKKKLLLMFFLGISKLSVINRNTDIKQEKYVE